MRININPNDFVVQPIPAGIYKAVVTGTKVRTSASGNQVINLELTVQSQGPDENIKTIGRKLFDGLTLSESALGVVNSKFKALTGKDLPAGDFEIDELINLITSSIMNRTCLVQVNVEAKRDDAEVFVNTVKSLKSFSE